MACLKYSVPLPGKECWPNTRCHWSAEARAKQKLRAASSQAATEAVSELGGWDTCDQGVLRLTYYHAVNRKRDGDGGLSAAKSAIDGLQDAGIIHNDCGIVHLPVRFLIDKENPRLELEFYGGTGVHILLLQGGEHA